MSQHVARARRCARPPTRLSRCTRWCRAAAGPAGEWLARVDAPTLLIVGGRDDVVLKLNRQAQQAILAESRLAVVPGATHLFEEPGALEKVAALAREWFATYLKSRRLGT